MDQLVADMTVHSAERSATAFLGRVMLAAIFLVSGFAKLADPAGAIGYMTKAAVPYPEQLVYVAAIAEIAGGVALVLGLLARVGAAGLVVYLAIVTYLMHDFWNLPAELAKPQMVQAMKNLCIMGGLAMVVAFGPGRLSVDRLLRRPKEA